MPSKDEKDIFDYVDKNYKDFVLTGINPGADERDAKDQVIPKDVMKKANRLGMMTFGLPAEHGGWGATSSQKGLMMERIGYWSDDLGFPFLINIYTSLTKSFLEIKNNDIVERYKKNLIDGDMIPAFCYTDGADPFSFKSQFKKKEDKYVLDGHKVYVSSARSADMFFVYLANADSDTRDLGMFLVKRTDPGVRIGTVDSFCFRGTGTGCLYLDNVILDPDRALIKYDALSHAQKELNSRRCLIIIPALGRLKALFELASDHFNETIRYKKPLSGMQHIQFQLGDLFARYLAARHVLFDALKKQDDNESNPIWEFEISAAKYFAVEQINYIVSGLIKLLATEAYLSHNKLERSLRNFSGLFSAGTPQGTISTDLGVFVLSSFGKKK